MNPTLKTGLVVIGIGLAGVIAYKASDSLSTDVKVAGGVAAGGISVWILAALFL
jgi:hypothetical protein